MARAYRTAPGGLPKDPKRVAVLEALKGRTDYKLAREMDGTFQGNVLQVLVPVGRNHEF